MTLTEVVSSNISKIGYEGTDLIVEYKSGTKYKYKEVPETVHRELLEASSKGSYMNSNIKGKYEYERV